MCLSKITSERYRTNTDITAYKVLDKHNGELFHEFYDDDVAIKFGVKYTARQEDMDNIIDPSVKYTTGFHAFVDREQAKDSTERCSQVVAQITVPKGAWVQYGEQVLSNGIDAEAIVVSEIIFEKVL